MHASVLAGLFFRPGSYSNSSFTTANPPQHTSLHRALIPPPPLSIPIPLPLLLRGGCDLCYDASLYAQRSQRRGQKAAPVEVHLGGGRDTQKRGTPEPSYRYNEAAKVNMDCWRRRSTQGGRYRNNTHKPGCEKLIGEVQASLGSFGSEMSNLFCFAF